MKKYYLLRKDDECKTTEKTLTIWSDIFEEIEDRIEILSREYRKDFKNIKVGDDIIYFDCKNVNIISTATVIESRPVTIQDMGIKSKCIVLKKIHKKINLNNMNSNDLSLKFIKTNTPNLSLIEIEKNEYLKILCE